jgi:hypothetical protein
MMALVEDLERIATAAARPSEKLTGILAVELLDGGRVYLCAYESGAWLALDDEGQAVTSRRRVRDAASLSALTEAIEEVAGVEPPLPRLASHAYLDALGQGVGPSAGAAVEGVMPVVDGLVEQILARHLTPLA